jgi:uncharacterized membrane protein
VNQIDRFSRSILPSMGFAVLGLFSFGLACAVLLVRSDALTGDPVRGLVLALTHLITLGWIGSLLFAGAYLFGPVLVRAPLWSERLPLVIGAFLVALVSFFRSRSGSSQ